MRKTFTAATTCLSLLCSLPHEGICSTPDLAKEIVKNAENVNPEIFLNQIDQLEKELENADDTLAECRAFLRVLVAEMNAQYGISLTLQELCQTIRENLDAFQIPDENRAEFLEALDLLEAEDSLEYQHRANAWNFFEKGKQNAKKIKQKCGTGSAVVFAILCVTGLGIVFVCPTVAPAAMTIIGGAATVFFSQDAKSGEKNEI
jgi:hypothetical protein